MTPSKPDCALASRKREQPDFASRRKVAVVTGATDGIGLELARLYLQQDYRLVLIGCRPLANLGTGLFNIDNYCQVDLSHESAAYSISQFLVERGIDEVDVLIHNAAVAWAGDFADQSAESIRNLLAVNLMSAIELTHALASRLERGKGVVAFISSIVACLPSPKYAVYAASKSGLDAFARALGVEWRGRIDVCLIGLGPVQTGMHAKAGMQFSVRQRRLWPLPQKIARQIALAISDRKSKTIGLSNRAVAFLGKRFPRIVERVAGARSYPNREFSGRVLVTGAAYGIGRAVCEELLRRGVSIVGLDVDKGRLAAFEQQVVAAGEQFEAVVADLSKLEDMHSIAATLASLGRFVGVVHNAGISAVGPFETIAVEKFRAVAAVNLFAPLLLTRALLANNCIEPGGSLTFVSSLSHHVGYPGAAVYAATKSALASFASSLRPALRDRSISVLTVFPGPTRTAHARRYSPDNSREERRMPAEDLARQIVAAIQSRRARLIPGWTNRLAAIAGTWFPRIIDRAMRRALFEPLKCLAAESKPIPDPNS